MIILSWSLYFPYIYKERWENKDKETREKENLKRIIFLIRGRHRYFYSKHIIARIERRRKNAKALCPLQELEIGTC